jgi:phosphoribosylpyrophosphate synthetase
MVEILENVRGKDVFVLQSTCAPTNDSLMEMLVMVDALKRASAGRITAAIPVFWICAARSKTAFRACADYRQSGGQYAYHRWY